MRVANSSLSAANSAAASAIKAKCVCISLARPQCAIVSLLSRNASCSALSSQTHHNKPNQCNASISLISRNALLPPSQQYAFCSTAQPQCVCRANRPQCSLSVVQQTHTQPQCVLLQLLSRNALLSAFSAAMRLGSRILLTAKRCCSASLRPNAPAQLLLQQCAPAQPDEPQQPDPNQHINVDKHLNGNQQQSVNQQQRFKNSLGMDFYC